MNCYNKLLTVGAGFAVAVRSTTPAGLLNRNPKPAGNCGDLLPAAAINITDVGTDTILDETTLVGTDVFDSLLAPLPRTAFPNGAVLAEVTAELRELVLVLTTEDDVTDAHADDAMKLPFFTGGKVMLVGKS